MSVNSEVFTGEPKAAPQNIGENAEESLGTIEGHSSVIESLNEVLCTSGPKRKRIRLSAEKKERDKVNHPMRPRCEPHTKVKADTLNCAKFSEEERKSIWESYWSENYTARRKTLLSCVHFLRVNRRVVSPNKSATSDVELYKKNETKQFFLVQDNVNLRVCQNFLLSTLGYSSNSVINELSKAVKDSEFVENVIERRGTNPKSHKLNEEIIKKHVLTFNPVQPHYRRLNAPNVRYLPRELTLKVMLADFKERHPGEKCGEESYRKVIKAMNISLKLPSSDECADCAEYKLAEKEGTISAETTEKQQAHLTKTAACKKLYTEDATRNLQPEECVFSMDLQKVLLLPVMPSIKDAFFTSRLVVFNETYAPIAAANNKLASKTTYCVIWHEAIEGRKADSLVSSLCRVFEAERGENVFILYCDNCSAQNKNWCFYSAIVQMVNSTELSHVRSVTLRYLVKGHTHMSADSVHGNIETKIKSKGALHDFEDLLEVVRNARKQIIVKEQKIEHFRHWKSLKAVTKKATVKLGDIQEASFKRGFSSMFVKLDLSEDGKEVHFLQKKVVLGDLPERKTEQRGINKEK